VVPEAVGAEATIAALALTGVGNLVSLVSDIAARGEKSTPGHQRRRAPEDE
jgi:hypothetical protein